MKSRICDKSTQKNGRNVNSESLENECKIVCIRTAPFQRATSKTRGLLMLNHSDIFAEAQQLRSISTRMLVFVDRTACCCSIRFLKNEQCKKWVSRFFEQVQMCKNSLFYRMCHHHHNMKKRRAAERTAMDLIRNHTSGTLKAD